MKYYDFMTFLEHKIQSDGREYVKCKDTFESDMEDWINSLDPMELIEYADEYKLTK